MTIDQRIDSLTEKLARASSAIERLPAVTPAVRKTAPETLSIADILRARQEVLAARAAAGRQG